MSVAVAIGVGCRKDSPATDIEVLVRRTLAGIAGAAPLGLFTIADKKGEIGLSVAAARLGLKLTYLDRDTLKAREAETQTRSERAETLFGVASVAEAAALAGAGPASVLIVPRISENGATCAVARSAP